MTHPPAALLAWRQFIIVKLVPLPNGQTDKLPVDYRTGEVTPKGSDGAFNPAVWLDYSTAAATAEAWGPAYGVGFVLTGAEGLFCIDVDGALQADGSTWSALAQQLHTSLPGCMVEVSQSGRGLHFWGRAQPMPEHSKKNTALHIECYSERRFILLGTYLAGAIAESCPTIAAVVAEYFPPRTEAGEAPDDGPRPEWRGPTDDDELLRRAMQSKSAASVFGGKVRASFADLWTANVEVLSKAYPPDASSSEPFDRSSADAALAQHLAFWTGASAARIERLMRRSALMRDKWNDRSDYLVDKTITKACRMQREVLQDKPPPAPPLATAASEAPTMTARTSDAFLRPEQQSALFAGCVYVVDQHRVLVPGGRLLKPEQFRAAFGGFTFVMDSRNERTTRHAFEAFTESQVLQCPKVENVFFDPDAPPGAIVERYGRHYANVYVPLTVPRKTGDVGPFLRHLEKLLPEERDRQFLLYYLANMVQLKGRKFQFAPLIVGVAGNGKTFLSRCIERALGDIYCFWPDPQKIGNQFNQWLLCRFAYLVEDAYIKGASVPLIEKLKPMITSDRLEIEGKGIDQISGRVCGNFIFNSNHKDAIKKTGDDRRYMVLWCAQQRVEDLARDGMGPAYFEALYGWAENRDGYAIVAEYLHTVPVPAEFGLSWVMGRAPLTTSTRGAIEATRGPIELAILDAIDEEAPGFKGGWVSSVMLARRLEARRLNAAGRTELPELLRGLGYILHPALGERGQVNNAVMPDGAKPRLYVRQDAPALIGLRDAGQAAAAYSHAQMA